jgi:hypothetical protein
VPATDSKEAHMTRRESLFCSLAVLGIVALFAGVAQAGGGSGTGQTGFEGLQCYTINGVNQDRVVDLSDQFGQRDSIKVGSGRLICTPVTGELVDGTDLGALPVDDTQEPPVSLADHYKCYDIPPFAREGRRLRLVDVNAQVEITDQFDIEVVKAHTPILLCMRAAKRLITPEP